jgi:pyruvate formate-lyase activating enzyme-like uncharacterized protein
MSRRKENMIRFIRGKLGSAYHDLRWLTDAEASKANRQRDALLHSLAGGVHREFADTKIYTGTLSPGCRICGHGGWSCMFINGLCTANCFYCPQDRGIREERETLADGVTFQSADDYVEYLKLPGFKGVGFTGGEPLLVFDKLCTYLEKIRAAFGQKLYLWIYTNGDLVDRDKLKTLRSLGVNEIRFNISAQNYDLSTVELAVPEMDTVTVEIPAIPEDEEIVMDRMAVMQAIGVRHLNLHQILANEHNYGRLAQRGYTFLHQDPVAVLESELTALALIRHALDGALTLPVNYCGVHYKGRFQNRGTRQRIANQIRKPFEDVTRNGYIRQLSVRASHEEIDEMISIFRRNGCTEDLWSRDATGGELFIHSSLARYLNGKRGRLLFTYSLPNCIDKECRCRVDRQVALPSGGKLAFTRNDVLSSRGMSDRAAEGFRAMCLEGCESQEVMKNFAREYPLKGREDMKKMLQEKDALLRAKDLEAISNGLPELF